MINAFNNIYKYVMYVYVYIFDHICIYVYRRKFRSQTSNLWTDAATGVRTVREEKESEKRE